MCLDLFVLVIGKLYLYKYSCRREHKEQQLLFINVILRD